MLRAAVLAVVVCPGAEQRVAVLPAVLAPGAGLGPAAGVPVAPVAALPVAVGFAVLLRRLLLLSLSRLRLGNVSPFFRDVLALGWLRGRTLFLRAWARLRLRCWRFSAALGL